MMSAEVLTTFELIGVYVNRLDAHSQLSHPKAISSVPAADARPLVPEPVKGVGQLGPPNVPCA